MTEVHQVGDFEINRVKEDIAKVLQAFTNSEIGNRITQFNMSGLANMLMGAVDGKVSFTNNLPEQPEK